MRRFSLAALCFLLALAACNKEDPTGPTPIEEEEFAPALGVDLSRMTATESGLYIEDLTVGGGAEAEAGKHVWVHYTGWLVDGTKFDSSISKQPIDFVLGTGRVIRGWDEGLKGLRVGGTRRLIIPSHLAYDKKGSKPVIPPHATLVFEVALTAVN